METAYIKDSFTDFKPRWSGSLAGDGNTECVVPDNMPDIGTIIDADGILCIRSKQIINGNLEVKADVSVKVIYQPEGETCLAGLNVDTEIVLRRELGADDNAIAYAELMLKSVDAKTINSRKLSVKTEASGSCVVYEKAKLEVVRAVEPCSCSVETREESFVTYPISDIREKTFVVTDDVTLPADAEDAERILNQRVSLTVTELEFTADRLLFRGCARIFLLLSKNGNVHACHLESTFSQIMEISGDESASPDINLCLTGAYLDLPDHSGGKLGVELHILAQVICRKKAEISCITDIYSNQRFLEAEYREYPLCFSYRRQTVRQPITVSVETARNSADIIYTKCSVISAAVINARAEFALNVKCIYRDESGSYYSASRRIQQAIDMDNTPEGEVVLSDCNASVTAVRQETGSIELKINLEGTLSIGTRQNIFCLVSLDEKEGKLPDAPSITLLYADGECDLWALAKQHRSTRKAILEANGGKIQGLILIPKCR